MLARLVRGTRNYTAKIEDGKMSNSRREMVSTWLLSLFSELDKDTTGLGGKIAPALSLIDATRHHLSPPLF